ncbi:hypothetical protein [Metabacillus arenae]|uniref:Uncharacterized protein n=1 Tax=Metabacillus arenae TaxID=2771434 RepID=A0A926RVZ2_9BACI|nr:hypothetical protein [Metabacillus arenae]MBD1379010.1 hypothetical protein [Metabacillus arenae]
MKMDELLLEKWLIDLEKELNYKKIKHINEIITDYREHILIKHLETKEPIERILTSIGSVDEIVNLYKKKQIVPEKIRSWFVFVNGCFFAAGAFLTFCRHSGYFVSIWEALAAVNWFILFGYAGFWLFVGYQLGKEFGVKGTLELPKTILFTTIPNVVLMACVLSNIIPKPWFESMLSPGFMIACVIITLLFYPLAMLGVKLGMRFSL